MVIMLAQLTTLLTLSMLSVGQEVEPQLEEPDLTKVKFFLWTRENREVPDTLELTLNSLEQSHFNSDHKVVIVLHGWNSHGESFGDDFALAYLDVGEYNVIAVDWGDLETWANYPQAAIRARKVGEHSVELVKVLLEVGPHVFSNIHLVGHSLGAHAAGFLAKKVQQLGMGKISRVTGLDPAKPMFDLAGPEDRIDKSDADFVDIVHTNSGSLLDGCLSLPEQIGHIDFYPAGGAHQPGCIEACIPNVDCINATVIDLLKGGCSHGRSHEYFVESVMGGQFLGWRCQDYGAFEHGDCCEESTAVLGEWVDHSAPEGKYFMHVNEESPFSQGSAGSNWF